MCKAVRAILDHWEMCSNRNGNAPHLRFDEILDHWEMCSNRNRDAFHQVIGGILDHWEMCSNRNLRHPIVAV